MNDHNDLVVDLTTESIAAFFEERLITDDSASPESDAETPMLAAARDSLSNSATWVEPPPQMRASVIDAITAEAAQDTTRTTAAAKKADLPRARSDRWQTIGTVAASLALAVGVFGAGWQIGSQDRSSVDIAITMVATDLAPDAQAYTTLTATPSGIEVTLDTSGLPPAPEGEYYQGWIKTHDGVGITIGTFHARGEDSVVLWSGLDLDDVAAVTVTRQRVDEGPESSGEVVLKATLD